MDDIFEILDGGYRDRAFVSETGFTRISFFDTRHIIFNPQFNVVPGLGSRFLTLTSYNSVYTVCLQDIYCTEKAKDPECYDALTCNDPEHFSATLTIELRPAHFGMVISMREHTYYTGSRIQNKNGFLPVNDGMFYQKKPIHDADELLDMLKLLRTRRDYVRP